MKCQREKFFLQRKYAYLNCAYMSPLLKKVEHAGIKGLRKKRRPFHVTSEDFFHETETVRLLYSKLIDNPQPNRIVVIPSVSYGLANVIKNIPFRDGEILLMEEQFPSNYYPWKSLEEKGFRLRTIHAPNTPNRAKRWNERVLESIHRDTRVVALGHVHWSDGTLFDLKAIRSRLDEVGGLLIVDGTQSVGALPFSIQELNPDALICAAYKWLMGPYSIGLAYYGPVFDEGSPIEDNWINRKNSGDFARLVKYQSDYREGSLRYEVGEHSNFIGIPMMHEAIKQLLKWTPDGIQDYCKALTSQTLIKLREMGYLIEENKGRGQHLFGVRVPSHISIGELQKSFKKHRVSVSFRGNTVRISPHVYNDEMDIKKLLKAMETPIFAKKD